MIAGKIITWILILAFVTTILFVVLIALPVVIGLVADAIDDMKLATDKLKDALQRKENR